MPTVVFLCKRNFHLKNLQSEELVDLGTIGGGGVEGAQLMQQMKGHSSRHCNVFAGASWNMETTLLQLRRTKKDVTFL